MELESILLALNFGLIFAFLAFYIIDTIRIKKLKLTIKPNNFLGKLKHKILDEVNKDKKFFFMAAVSLTIFFILFLIIENPIQESIYKSNFDKLIKLNASEMNKTVQEATKIAENFAGTSANNFSIFIKMYLVFFTIAILFLFIYYIGYKLNRHFKMEEAVKKNTLRLLLNQLEVKEKHIHFYEAIEKKYGSSRDENTYDSLAVFIYNTLQSKKGKKLF